MKEIRKTDLNIIQMELSLIKPYQNNPRRHSREQLNLIKESIEKLGNRKPIEIDENNIIICGHGRLEAYKELEFKTVPVIIHSDMTESEKKAYRIADNEIALKSEWDIELLNMEIDNIDFDIESIVKFNEKININLDEIPENKEGEKKENKYTICPKCGFEIIK
jgi:ParB family transcriptional regulator, chromosome partitioning protein